MADEKWSEEVFKLQKCCQIGKFSILITYLLKYIINPWYILGVTYLRSRPKLIQTLSLIAHKKLIIQIMRTKPVVKQFQIANIKDRIDTIKILKFGISLILG